MRGVVVAPQPLAVEVGREILRRGGNAFDAAIAAAFVQAITDPLMCGIGGMGAADLRPTWRRTFLHHRGGLRQLPPAAASQRWPRPWCSRMASLS